VTEWLLRLRGYDAWSKALIQEPAIEILEKVHASPGILPLGAVNGAERRGAPGQELNLRPTTKTCRLEPVSGHDDQLPCDTPESNERG
jgi:hypothetical protein